MEFERFALDPISRRRFFRASGVATAGGSAAFLAACGSGSGDTRNETAAAADIAVLNSAIDLENTAIAAYTAGAPLLKGEVLRLGREFLGQEKEHADALSTAVTQLGGHSSRPKAAYDFPRVRTQRDVLLLTHLVGLSLGGVVAQQFALDYPTAAASLVLADTFCGTPPEHRDTVHAALQFVEDNDMPAVSQVR